MCNKVKSKKKTLFFAWGFSNTNLTEIYTELELKIARPTLSKAIRINPSAK